jgi:hypothetical protein
MEGITYSGSTWPSELGIDTLEFMVFMSFGIFVGIGP